MYAPISAKPAYFIISYRVYNSISKFTIFKVEIYSHVGIFIFNLKKKLFFVFILLVY